MAPSSDPDADAVLASFDHPEAARAPDAAAVLASYDAPHPQASGKQNVAELVRHEASLIPAAIGGGFRSIYDLASGKTIAETDQRYQQYVAEHATPVTNDTVAAMSKMYDKSQASGFNPLTWPGRLFD